MTIEISIEESSYLNSFGNAIDYYTALQSSINPGRGELSLWTLFTVCAHQFHQKGFRPSIPSVSEYKQSLLVVGDSGIGKSIQWRSFWQRVAAVGGFDLTTIDQATSAALIGGRDGDGVLKRYPNSLFLIQDFTSLFNSQQGAEVLDLFNHLLDNNASIVKYLVGKEFRLDCDNTFVFNMTPVHVTQTLARSLVGGILRRVNVHFVRTEDNWMNEQDRFFQHSRQLEPDEILQMSSLVQDIKPLGVPNLKQEVLEIATHFSGKENPINYTILKQGRPARTRAFPRILAALEVFYALSGGDIRQARKQARIIERDAITSMALFEEALGIAV